MCLSQWIFEEETHKTYSWKYNKFLLESAKTHISSQKLHKCFLFCKLWQISFSDSLDRWQIPLCGGKWFVTTGAEQLLSSTFAFSASFGGATLKGKTSTFAFFTSFGGATLKGKTQTSTFAFLTYFLFLASYNCKIVLPLSLSKKSLAGEKLQNNWMSNWAKTKLKSVLRYEVNIS